MHKVIYNGFFYILMGWILFMSACGGFQSVKDLEAIKPPADLAPELNKKLEVKKPSETKNSRALHPKKSEGSVFESEKGRHHEKWYGQTKALRTGEKTRLALTWFTLKAGEVTLEVHPDVEIEGRLAYHFVGTAKSSSMMDLIHSVDDGMESFVDKKTFFPLKASLHGIETDRIREGRILFDYDKRKLHYWMKRVHVKKGAKEDRREDDFLPGILDIFSAAFFLRVQPLEVDKTYLGELYNEGKHISIKAKVIGRETLVTDIGDFDALVIQPEARFEGILKMSGDSRIWVTNDERHFILRLETKIRIGTLKGEVVEINDPHYTFSSRLPEKK